MNTVLRRSGEWTHRSLSRNQKSLLTPEEPVKEWEPQHWKPVALYEKSEEQETMVERLRTKPAYNRDNLDELATRLEDWEGLISKMAFVSQSKKDKGKLTVYLKGCSSLHLKILEETDVWFVGDVHGDLLGFLAVLDAMEQYSRIMVTF